MLDLLNMKGKHKHKWDYLREVLGERVVYDDMLHRLWYCDDSCTQGVLFSCKQGQINMDRPIGRWRTGPKHVGSKPFNVSMSYGTFLPRWGSPHTDARCALY